MVLRLQCVLVCSPGREMCELADDLLGKMAPVAEGLVACLVTAAETVVFIALRLRTVISFEDDAARYLEWSAPGDADSGRAIEAVMVDAILVGVGERPARTALDGADDLFDRRPIGVYPRAAAEVENTGKFETVAVVRADSEVEVNRNLFADISLHLVRRAVGPFTAVEPLLGVRSVAVGEPFRFIAAAECHDGLCFESVTFPVEEILEPGYEKGGVSRHRYLWLLFAFHRLLP